jgi:TolB protein
MMKSNPLITRITLMTLMLFSFIFATMSVSAEEVLQIKITKEGEGGGIGIIIAPFAGGNLSKIVEADLQRSGRFNLIDPARASQPLQMGGSLQAEPLRATGAQYLVVGRQQGGLEFEILDVANGQRIAGYRIPNLPNQRRMAHKAADLIFEKLTNVKGAFDTRIAYVSVTGNVKSPNYRLIISDSDGHNPRTILSSRQPVLSPTWSPDASSLAYVSYESGEPAIYVQQLRSGSKRKVSGRPGMNNAPAWSPDGRLLAMSLSFDGGDPDIYVQRVHGGALRRITNTRGIDTEPSWSPDSNTIIFTSDRSGKPQLYRVSANGGAASRFSFGSSYTSDASVVGNKVAMVQQNGSAFQIAVRNASAGGAQVVSRGSLDESPSLAPNGTMVIYGSQSGGRAVLAVSSDNGKAHQVLYSQSGDVRDPAWSPFLR